MVGVAAHLRGEVEGDGEAGLAVLREVLEAGVGLLGGAETSVLAHGPGLAAVHGRVGAAGVGVLARVPELLGVVEAFEIVGPVDGFDLDPGLRATLVGAFLGVHCASSPVVSGVLAILLAR